MQIILKNEGNSTALAVEMSTELKIKLA